MPLYVEPDLFNESQILGEERSVAAIPFPQDVLADTTSVGQHLKNQIFAGNFTQAELGLGSDDRFP